MKVLFIIGPSGVGKSSLLLELSKKGIIQLTPSWTTRPARIDEKNGSIEHVFVEENEFNKLKKDNFFIETFTLFGLPYQFGLPRIKNPNDGAIPAMVLRSYLVPVMAKHYPDHIIYAIEDDYIKVSGRLQARLARGELIGKRLEEFDQEIKIGRKLANKTFKNDSTIENLARRVQKATAIDFPK